MKQHLLIFVTLFAAFFVCSCSTTRMGGSGAKPHEMVDIYTGSRNQLDLIIATEPITYTIDVSTAEGKTKLQNLSIREAEGLAIREAVMLNRCAKLVDPQFTHFTKGKRVLRVTVYGFPAKYRNQN